MHTTGYPIYIRMYVRTYVSMLHPFSYIKGVSDTNKITLKYYVIFAIHVLLTKYMYVGEYLIYVTGFGKTRQLRTKIII